jgi:hypothetical protein
MLPSSIRIAAVRFFFVAFILFMILIKGSSTFVETMIQYTMNTSKGMASSYINSVLYSCLSGFLSVLFLYFAVASVAYVTFLAYGAINIKSEQSATTLQFMYIFLGLMLLFLFGYNIVPSIDVPDMPSMPDIPNYDGTSRADRPTPAPKPPCNNSSQTLSQVIIIFILPVIAALYCLGQLVYRGLIGITSAMDTSDMQHASKMKMVFGYFVFSILLYTLWPILLHFTIPSIIKSFGTKELLTLYYSRVHMLKI